MDPDPAFHLNSDPDLDSGSQTNADPCGRKQFNLLNLVNSHAAADSDPQQSNQCGSIRIRIHNTGLVCCKFAGALIADTLSEVI